MDYKKLLLELIDIVIKERGSDLHISEGRHPTIRVDGELIPLTQKEVLNDDDTVALVKELLTPEKLEDFKENQVVDFSYMHSDGNRFRGNAFVQQGHVSVALRLIPKKIETLEELGLPPILGDFARKQQGFFLIVGPVGSGKTTTLASMLQIINTERAEHIVTIENPIEYIHEQQKSIVDQREVGTDTKDFEPALVSALRQDIDVLLVGEMRNQKTMEAAITAAETGHLVFSTLHTNSASQTIDRIIDSFPAEQQGQVRLQLAGSLIGIFSQRLLKRVSGGRVPAYELLINNNAVANLIRENRTHEIDAVIETSLNQGMIDMNRSLAELVRQGEITYEEATLHSMKPDLLDKLL